MEAPQARRRYTVEDYLALERAALERHLYLDGEIYAMAGESGAHADISANLIAAMVVQLRGSPCRARTKDTKIRSGPIPETGHSARGMFSYPDIVVVCGEPEYHDAYRDIVLNPKIVIEVLSPATEAFDRGEKFIRYQTWNPSLTDYLLVAQDQAQAEHFQKAPAGAWSYLRSTGLESTIAIASIACVLKLSEVYDRVAFSSMET